MLKPGSVRFILAIIVILFHITKMIFLGHFAVLCFFILSGYWITLMYENKYKKFEASQKVFYISRVWRLLPVFLLFNCLAFVFSYYYNPHLYDSISLLHWPIKGIYWFSNFFLLGFFNMSSQALVPAWSLDIELQFYLLYPFLLLSFKKTDYWILSVFIIVALILSVHYPTTIISKTLIYYLFYFLIGMMIYLKNFSFSRKIETVFTCIFIFAVIINYIIPDLRKITVTNNATDYNRYLNECLPILLIPFISNSVKNKSSKLDRVLGDMSFVLYLCHWALIIPYNYYIKGLTVIHRVPYSLLYLIITFIVSYLIYKFYDKPIDNLRKKWVESHEIKKNREKMDTELNMLAKR
ncbi:MAG: Peptidoglycan/LPS O-acetylase OafA/YrhL, contains acyltransferase and SGNH-hydrolase domain [Mucilaginibacter sp.]|nr:Peptidoglycan/LPS O-acetylase OafA/YrhL, contains acyltransferase and SGNH-hydrolase domain [Mucilaginibacter sp.]